MAVNAGGDHRICTKEQLETEYAVVGLAAQKAAIVQMDNNQLGDVAKGARVIVYVLTRTGAGTGQEIPLRLVLGSDALLGIRKKLESTEKLLREWEDVIVSTDRGD